MSSGRETGRGISGGHTGRLKGTDEGVNVLVLPESQDQVPHFVTHLDSVCCAL